MSVSDRINYINIGLMLAAAVFAFALPFEAFLFSYAVLGPLHYLTEISWLHEKRYFTRHKQDYLLLVVLAVALFAVGLGIKAVFGEAATKHNTEWGTAIIYVAFASALALITLKKATLRAFALLAIFVTALFFKSLDSFLIFFSLFLPTLVHVFVFTGAFLLYGALKSRSKSGILSFIFFLACPVVIYLVNDFETGHLLHDYVKRSYEGFMTVNIASVRLLHLGSMDSKEQLFYSRYGLLVMRFIAYAYTYHYLNWFSKTEIIRWHEVSRPRIAVIVVLWITSLALYAINYQTGATALYCLSFLHVFLEFPLNHVTFLGISKELKTLLLPHAGARMPASPGRAEESSS